MKILHFQFFTFVFLLILATSPPAIAVNLCTSADSDSDGDGWGWENDASCLVDTTDVRQSPPVCELETSDPDGDGWGWENDASCKVDETASPVPGNSISAATDVAMDTILENTLTDSAEIHWYSFDINAGEFALELSANSSDDVFGELSLQLEDGSGTVRAQLDYFSQSEQSEVFCLDPGQYFLSIRTFFFPDETAIPYYAALTSTNLRCTKPEYTVPTESYTDVFTTFAGGYAYVGINGALVAETHTGQPLWTVNNILDGYTTGIIASDDNTVYAYNDQQITAVSSTGDELWTYETRAGSYLNHVTADNRGVYIVAGYNDIIGLDLNGKEQWLATAADGVDSIEIGDDGTLYLRTFDSVSVLRP